MRYFKSRLKGSAVGTIVGSAAAAIGVPIFCLIKWFTSGENLLGLGILFFIGGAIGVVVGVVRYRMIEERVSDDPPSDEQPFSKEDFNSLR